MYYLDDPRQPSEHVVERAKHCSAVKIGPGEYRVTPMTYGFPDHHGKDKRHVKFGEDKFGVYATCVDYYEEYYNVDRDDWGQRGTLWSYRSHVEVVFDALQQAIDLTGKPSLERSPCPCEGCKPEEGGRRSMTDAITTKG